MPKQVKYPPITRGARQQLKKRKRAEHKLGQIFDQIVERMEEDEDYRDECYAFALHVWDGDVPPIEVASTPDESPRKTLARMLFYEAKELREESDEESV